MKKTYFPHDSNARNDYKLIKLRSKYNYEGFGIYFALLELLFSENNKLRIDDFETLAFGLQCDSAILKDIIQNFDLFEFEGDFFYSKRLSKTLDDICQKSLKASENAKKRWTNTKAMQPQSNRIAIKVNESKVKKSKVNKIEERIRDFKKSVFSHNDFDNKDLEDFFLYWSELNKSPHNPKMRFELEKTWSLNLRLKRWVNNGFNKDKNKLPDYFDEVLYKKMDISSKKEYEKKLKQNGFSYSYNPNSGGKWIKKAGV
tara:strand:- start:3504 stop:4277 length:774 start_codon:yes stop_codon:yes gene_type:complete